MIANEDSNGCLRSVRSRPSTPRGMCASADSIETLRARSMSAGAVTISTKPVRRSCLRRAACPPKVDPNGVYAVEALRAMLSCPRIRGALPLLMWPGGGLTSVANKDDAYHDGREGWLGVFHHERLDDSATRMHTVEARPARAGGDVSGISSRRAGFPEAKENRSTFHIGPGSYRTRRLRSAAGGQPVPPRDSYDNFTSRSCRALDRPITRSSPRIPSSSAKKVCPMRGELHSQAGRLGRKSGAGASHAKVKRLLRCWRVEPAGWAIRSGWTNTRTFRF